LRDLRIPAAPTEEAFRQIFVPASTARRVAVRRPLATEQGAENDPEHPIE
jgi:hypothetical protein